jgi:APA family basic amino acid/polyamine antiporter
MLKPPAKGTISLPTATAITIANMVGTGVFTTLGFQVVGIGSGFALIVLWTLGGFFALCGALSYGELAAALPRSGGEFNFLGRIFHPAVGFLAGWISFTVGFAPPIALAAMAFGRYFARALPGTNALLLSCLVVALVTSAHLFNLRIGSWFQNLFTLFKVLLVVVFIAVAASSERTSGLSFAPQAGDLDVILGGPFAISLLFVMYAYAGWNAAVYVMDEVRDPEVTVPRSLVLGTAIVTVLYVGLNWAFLRVAPISELAGQIEVGHVAAVHILGEGGGRLMSAFLCLALVSTISAMTWAGPRVTQVMGQDFSMFRFLGHTTGRGIPRRAIVLQTAIVLFLLITATFETVLVYTQFALTLSSFLAVIGVFVLRIKAPQLRRPYKVWAYPLTPLLFAIISLVTLGHALVSRPVESLASLITILVGLPVYWLSRRLEAS